MIWLLFCKDNDRMNLTINLVQTSQ